MVAHEVALFALPIFQRELFSTYFLLPAWTTFWITMVSMPIGVVLGLLGALGRVSRIPVLRWVVAGYLWVFRGTPVLVQIVFWYFGTAELTGNFVNLPAVVAGVLALGVNEGAYMTEIVRAGLLSVDTGQQEAARALGMTYRQTMRRIVVPQALQVIIPPTGNEYISMLKTTSLLYIIAIPELFATAASLYSSDFRYFEALSVVSMWYLFLTSILSMVQRRLEDRYGAGRMDFARDSRGSLSRMFGFGATRGAR
ncbi:MAG: amino acid ABC transporter permease [Candidatus Dormibacteraceae bacterium]